MTSYLHPHVGNLIGQQRRRDMAARAERRRLARQFRPRTGASPRHWHWHWHWLRLRPRHWHWHRPRHRYSAAR